MKGAAFILTILGVAAFVASIFMAYTGFSEKNSERNERNAMNFICTVQAQITNTAFVEKGNSKDDSKKIVSNDYYVDFYITDGGTYTGKNPKVYVTESAYKEYEKLPRNKDMKMNLYRTNDGVVFLSFKDAEGAMEEYDGIAFSVSRKVFVGLGFLAAALILFDISSRLRKAARDEKIERY